MNLSPPPKTGIRAFDEWANEVYEFLKYPHFEQIRWIAKADASESVKGVQYLDSDDNVAKIHNGTDFQDLY